MVNLQWTPSSNHFFFKNIISRLVSVSHINEKSNMFYKLLLGFKLTTASLYDVGTNVGQVSQISLSIPFWILEGIIMNDTLIENWTISSHLCENGCENWFFFKRTKKFENQVRSDPLPGPPSKVSTSNEKEVMISNLIMFLCKIEQHIEFC